MVLMSSLPGNVQSAFRKALARVPQKVLWKYEGEMKDKPKNVMTKKWIPQRDILCTGYIQIMTIYYIVLNWTIIL